MNSLLLNLTPNLFGLRIILNDENLLESTKNVGHLGSDAGILEDPNKIFVRVRNFPASILED